MGPPGVSLARDLVVFEHNREHAVRVRGVVELGNGKESRSKLLKLPATSLHQVPRIVDDE